MRENTKEWNLRSDLPSSQTSSNTYSSIPAPGMGKVFARPSSSMTVLITSSDVDARAKNTFHVKVSWISGTRMNDKVTESEECKDTSRRVGVCIWDVRGKTEKCLTGVSLTTSGELSKGDTGNLGSSTPRVCQAAKGSVVRPSEHKG